MSSSVKLSNQKKGEIFEEYIRLVYIKANYRTTHITPSFDVNGSKFNVELLKPDLKFNKENSTTEFWVECKYRSYTHGKKDYEVITAEQLRRHTKLKDAPVYVLLGIGGKPNKPSYVYRIPIEECKSVMSIGELCRTYQINR